MELQSADGPPEARQRSEAQSVYELEARAAELELEISDARAAAGIGDNRVSHTGRAGTTAALTATVVAVCGKYSGEGGLFVAHAHAEVASSSSSDGASDGSAASAAAQQAYAVVATSVTVAVAAAHVPGAATAAFAEAVMQGDEEEGVTDKGGRGFEHWFSHRRGMIVVDL
jgi:hypothetical protein